MLAALTYLPAAATVLFVFAVALMPSRPAKPRRRNAIIHAEPRR